MISDDKWAVGIVFFVVICLTILFTWKITDFSQADIVAKTVSHGETTVLEVSHSGKYYKCEIIGGFKNANSPHEASSN
jgi:hypothetical protein